MEYLTKDYGFLGLVLYIVVKEIWPFFRDKFFPEKQKFEQTQEARVTVAIEGISTTMRTMSEGVMMNGARIDNLTSITAEHIRISNDAITAMLVRTHTIPKRKQTTTKQ